VLSVLANVAGGDKDAKAEVRVALGGISEWFDDYISTEEADPTMVRQRARPPAVTHSFSIGTRAPQGNGPFTRQMLGLQIKD
jgi:hypothetical protein